LQIEMLLGLDRHKTHHRPLHPSAMASASRKSLLLVCTYASPALDTTNVPPAEATTRVSCGIIEGKPALVLL
jgi:hypothetical protein